MRAGGQNGEYDMNPFWSILVQEKIIFTVMADTLAFKSVRVALIGCWMNVLCSCAVTTEGLRVVMHWTWGR